MAATWGNNTWGANTWQSETVALSLTAPSTLTSSIGAVQAHNIEGWGRQEWGNSGWGVEYSVALTGLSATSNVGSVDAKDIMDVSLTAPSDLAISLNPLNALPASAVIPATIKITTAIHNIQYQSITYLTIKVF